MADELPAKTKVLQPIRHRTNSTGFPNANLPLATPTSPPTHFAQGSDMQSENERHFREIANLAPDPFAPFLPPTFYLTESKKPASHVEFRWQEDGVKKMSEIGSRGFYRFKKAFLSERNAERNAGSIGINRGINRGQAIFEPASGSADQRINRGQAIFEPASQSLIGLARPQPVPISPPPSN